MAWQGGMEGGNAAARASVRRRQSIRKTFRHICKETGRLSVIGDISMNR